MNRKLNRPLVFFAAIYLAMGVPFIIGWWRGAFEIFWTVPGAALVQMIGCSIGCLWGAWMVGEKKVV